LCRFREDGFSRAGRPHHESLTFALRRPITIMVGLVSLLVGSGLALWRMKVDIFPQLNLPVVYVVQPYGGMDPAQMEALLTFHYENHFLYIAGIDHVESRNIQGFSQMKVFFHPGTDMVQAMAEVVAQVNRARSFMPQGTVAPFVVRFDAGSVPVGYLVLESQTKTIDEIQEAAYKGGARGHERSRPDPSPWRAPPRETGLLGAAHGHEDHRAATAG
jgi:multidrug efflux pump subunit AcrB